MKAVMRRHVCLLVLYLLMLGVIAVWADLGVSAWVFRFAGQLPYGDKIGHMILAAILSFLLNNALSCRVSSFGRMKILTGNLIAYLLVLIEETSQFWMTMRNVDIWDVLASLVGIHLFGFLAALNVKRREG
jgi:hypothetical protein